MSDFLKEMEKFREEESVLLQEELAIIGQDLSAEQPAEPDEIIEEKELTFEDIIGLTPFLEQENSDGALTERNKILINFSSVLKRLEASINLEISFLEKNDFSCLKDTNTRKTRGLHDLSVILTHAEPYKKDPEIKEFLRGGLFYLQKSLKRNEALLAIHLKAVTELSSMIKDAAQAREADGTYRPL